MKQTLQLPGFQCPGKPREGLGPGLSCKVCPGLICSAVLAMSTARPRMIKTSLLYGLVNRGMGAASYR
ncbi:hypothetical protein WJX79_001325 [Trebouxia sp. C0005]